MNNVHGSDNPSTRSKILSSPGVGLRDPLYESNSSHGFPQSLLKSLSGKSLYGRNQLLWQPVKNKCAHNTDNIEKSHPRLNKNEQDLDMKQGILK